MNSIVSFYINKVPTRVKPYFIILFASILIVLSFAPWNFWPIGFICLSPIFYLWNHIKKYNVSFKKIIWLSIILSFLISIFAFYWLFYTIQTFGHLPFIPALFIFTLYAVGSNLRWIVLFIFAYFYYKSLCNQQSLHSSKWIQWIYKIYNNHYIMLTGFWGICEYFTWQLFPYYGINLVSKNIFFIQIVDTLGTYGSSLVWFFFNLIFFDILKEYVPRLHKQTSKKNLNFKNPFKKTYIFYALILFFCIHLYGVLQYFYWENKQQQFDVQKIGIVQANMPLSFNSSQHTKNSSVLKLINQSKVLLQENPNLDILIWPEGSIPYLSYQTSNFLRQEIEHLQSQYAIPIIFNDIYQDTNNWRRYYSRMALLSKDGNITQQYFKHILLAFGEVMPLSDTFPWLLTMFPEVSSFTKGEDYPTLLLQSKHILPLICYEGIVTDFVSQFVSSINGEAQWFLNITNDSWFGDTSIEKEQHLQLTSLRAIEYRVPFVRATNSGITAWFDTKGTMHGATQKGVIANKVYNVPIPNNKINTLYFYLQNKIFFTFIFFIFLIFLLYTGLIKLKIKS